MSLDDVLARSAADVARLYRERSLSPVDVTRACLQRIADRNDEFGAFIVVTGDAALVEARTLERELIDGADRGPLHGIPVAVKDIVDIAGLPTTCGSLAAPPDLARVDADIVTGLKAAGAIIVGKTHLMEFALADVHEAFPPTRNPAAPSRVTGGSSSGSAAAVAAGLCYAAIGSDTAGSIRIPAANCGIVGLKPTLGWISMAGVFPVSASLDTVGPMTRTVADAAAALGAMAGRSLVAEPRGLRGLRVGVMSRFGRDGAEAVGEAAAAAFEDACQALKSQGVQLRPVDLPELDNAVQMLMDIILPEAACVHEERIRTVPERLTSGTRDLLRQGARVPARAYIRAQAARRLLEKAAASVFETCDALVSPTVPTSAPPWQPDLISDNGYAEMSPSALTNMTGAPGLTMPWGTDADGAPLGLHVAAPFGKDTFLLSVAESIERLRALTAR